MACFCPLFKRVHLYIDHGSGIDPETSAMLYNCLFPLLHIQCDVIVHLYIISISSGKRIYNDTF
jgi:hypothetical protein